MASPSGSVLGNIYDMVRMDIFGSTDAWVQSAASGIPNSQMDIYTQKIAYRINMAVAISEHVTINTTAGTVSPARDEIYNLLIIGIEALIKNTESSLLKRLSSGVGMTVSSGEGVSVKNADGVQVSNLSRYQERMRVALSESKQAMQDFKDALAQYKYEVAGLTRRRYVY